MDLAQLVTLFVQGGIGAAALYVLWRIVALVLSHSRELADQFQANLAEVVTGFHGALDRFELRVESMVDRLERAIREKP